MIIRAALPYLLLLLLLLPACSDDSVSPGDSSPGLDGTIVDAEGLPVAGAAVHVILHTNPDTFLHKATESNASTTISFSVTQMPYVHVTMKILRYGTRELMLTPFDDVAAPGRYNILIESKQVGNGVFIASINIGGAISEQQFLLNTDNIGLLTECPPVATSDSDGKFSLSYSILGIGTTVNQPAPEGGTIPVVVTSIVDLVVLKGGFVPLVMRDTVDVTVSDTSSFMLAR